MGGIHRRIETFSARAIDQLMIVGQTQRSACRPLLGRRTIAGILHHWNAISIRVIGKVYAHVRLHISQSKRRFLDRNLTALHADVFDPEGPIVRCVAMRLIDCCSNSC